MRPFVNHQRLSDNGRVTQYVASKRDVLMNFRMWTSELYVIITRTRTHTPAHTLTQTHMRTTYNIYPHNHTRRLALSQIVPSKFSCSEQATIPTPHPPDPPHVIDIVFFFYICLNSSFFPGSVWRTGLENVSYRKQDLLGQQTKVTRHLLITWNRLFISFSPD